MINRVIVDPTTLAQIENASQPVELCDASGQVIGRFVPVPRSAQIPQVSEEELDRRQLARGGRSLNEILADLEKQA